MLEMVAPVMAVVTSDIVEVSAEVAVSETVVEEVSSVAVDAAVVEATVLVIVWVKVLVPIAALDSVEIVVPEGVVE